MGKRVLSGVSAALMAFTALTASPALASSHREAPGITAMPKVDNTDVYAFRSYEPGRSDFTTIIANFQPFEDPFAGPNYYTMDPDAIYEIHVDNTGDAIENLTFQFKFANTRKNNDKGLTVNVGGKDLPIALRAVTPVQNAADATVGDFEDYTVTMITGDRRSGTRAAVTNGAAGSLFRKPIDNIGLKTIPNYAAYAAQFVFNVTIPGCATQGKVFVGQRAEAFAINVGAAFDSVNFVPIEGDSAPGAGDGKGFPGGITQNRAANDDLVGKKNVTSIAMEIPTACLKGAGNGVIGIWSTASLPQARLLRPTPALGSVAASGGAYVQVSRLGMPLVNELVIGLPDKDLFNAVKPTKDAALLDYVTNPTFPAILNVLFKDPVNKTLGTNIPNLAPSNFPRNDLVATYLTGIATLNQMSKVTPSEMIRLNTNLPITPRESQSNLGVLGDDIAGFPNGRRPGDDVGDITLRVAMGRLCYPVPVQGKATDLGLCTAAQAPVGNVNFTDGAPISARDLQNQFPYLNTPLPGSPRSARPGS